MERTLNIAVVGLGYVGLPLATLFSKCYKTVGFDINQQRIDTLLTTQTGSGDITTTTLKEQLERGLQLTSDENILDGCNVKVVAVPTPVDKFFNVDLSPLKSSSQIVGRHLHVGDIVVYESTVYPGLTEEICIPILEDVSGLKFNEDFYVGYSPERINPGDKVNTVETIVKVTSGSTPEVADIIDNMYSSVLLNGTHKAPSLRVAEASKIVENCQRDVLIAFMNEMYKLFREMGINVDDVRKAAATKWNFVNMTPGLVGGHCIAVDPYYLIEKAASMSLDMPLLRTARRINNSMAPDYACRIINFMNLHRISVPQSNVLLLGFAFKKDSEDVRNTLVANVYHSLRQYCDNVTVFDPHVSPEKAMHEYGIPVVNDIEQIKGKKYGAIAICTPHTVFDELDIDELLAPNGVYCNLVGEIQR